MRKLDSSAPAGFQAASTMRDVRPETDRASADHARSRPRRPQACRPAPEKRAVTPPPPPPSRPRPPADGPAGASRPPVAGGLPIAGGPPVAAGPPVAGGPAAGGDQPDSPKPDSSAHVSPAQVSPAQVSPAQAADPERPGDPHPAPPGDPGPGPEPPGEASPAHAAADDDGARVGTVISGRPPAAVPARPAEVQAAFPEPGQAPSWPRVIATTLRLWFERRRARRASARRRVLIIGIAIIVFAAGGLTFALAGGRSPAAKPGGGTPALSTGSVAAAAASRQAAATWVAAQVSHSVIVSCDPVMCATLQQDGFPAGDLLPLTASATDPLGSAVVVSTTALRNQFGRRLPDVYAPVVLATFGRGEARVDVRVEAPDGGRSYLVAQRVDELARQQVGQQLLANKDLHVPAAAGQEIAAGNLDSRLLSTLAALTGQVHEVNVIAVGDSGPGASAGVPLRMVRISALVSPGHPGRNASYLKAVLAFLKAQQPPYRASVSVRSQGGASIVQVQFAAPSPLGLLGPQAAP